MKKIKQYDQKKFSWWDLVAGAVFGLLFVFMLIAAITPEKDKFGKYTQPLQYWTDNAYYEANF